MSDTDYIRKAVELADGFQWRGETYLGRTNDPAILVDTPAGTTFPCDDQFMLDALAAQLVRQVDALDNYYVLSGHDGSQVEYEDELEAYCVCTTEGPDRTMNTIKAIVDSKVLE